MKRLKLNFKRDIPILHHLWKYKVSTTQGLWFLYSRYTTLWSTYKRLLTMESAGFITSSYSKKGTVSLWTLTEKGYATIAEDMSMLKDQGFKSESPMHDLVTSAFQIGEISNFENSSIKIISEQELRRTDPLQYVDSIPRTDRHRPDGYWVLEKYNTKNVFAIEIELNQKTSDNYEIVGKFYKDYPEINNAIWAVPKTGMIKIMKLNLEKHLFNEPSCHSFILLKDFLETGWDCKVIAGKDSGKSINELLGNRVGTRSVHTPFRHLLDTKKYSINSKVSISDELLKLIDCIPSQKKMEISP